MIYIIFTFEDFHIWYKYTIQKLHTSKENSKY